MFAKILSFTAAAVAATLFAEDDPARWVDPFIGTAGTANCHPNACYPHGMVQAGPTSGTEEWKYCGGDQFADRELYGFVQDAISGTGCADLGDIRIQPFVGSGENERKTAEKADEEPLGITITAANPNRVARGGSFAYDYNYARSARRAADLDNSGVKGDYGFRLACPLGTEWGWPE